MFTGAKSCELPSPHPFMRPEGSAKAPGYAHLVQEGAGGQACASAPEPIAADSYGTKKTPTPVVGEHGAEDSWEAPPPPPSPPSPPPPPLPFTGLPPPTPVPKRVIGKFKHLGCLLFSRDACHSLFLVAFILAGSLIFLTSVVKHDEVYSIVIVSVLTALSLSFLFCAVSIDPGIVPPLPYDQAATGDVRVIIKGTEVVCKVCTTCHIVRPPRSSHCRFCDVCVEEFDHHCGVLGCCVGRRTYRFFAGFFIVTLFLSLYALIRSIVVLAMFDYKRDNHDAASRWRIAASALCLAAGVFGAAFTAPFTGKYLMMSCLNTTEKELLRTNDTCSPNEPYHEGYCVNVVKRFFSRIPPSKVYMMESHSRLVELKGTTNLRDLGGYRTRDGRQQVRWGKVFRSDSLQPVAMADLASVLRDKMHVTDVFDLRAAAEIESRPYTLPDGICYHPLPLTAGMDRLHEYEAQNITITADIIHEIASDNYLSRVDHHGPDFATFFRFLMAPPTPPAGGEAVVLFHCTAGKDRTGLLAALLLAALGVERSTIMEDFLLTNQCFRRPVGLNVSSKKLVAMDAAAADAIWAVRPLYLEKTFAHLDERYGGVDGYLARQLHLSAEDLSLLRGNLLV